MKVSRFMYVVVYDIRSTVTVNLHDFGWTILIGFNYIENVRCIDVMTMTNSIVCYTYRYIMLTFSSIQQVKKTCIECLYNI